MITIFLGEDTAESRRHYFDAKKKCERDGMRVIELTKDTLPQLNQWLTESVSLFGEKNVFFAENILSKKNERELVKGLDTLSREKELYVWEETIEDRVAKFFFTHASLHISKTPETIFALLDNIYPDNVEYVITNFRQLSDRIDEHMILFMLQKRIKDLILVGRGVEPAKKIAGWQLMRLKNQAKRWHRMESLLDFYDGLYRIEMYEKTGTNYYSVHQALDILFSYYL